MTVHAVWKAIAVDNAQPPYDRIQLKVLYPAQQDQSLPVVIFFSGINCNLAMYEWLALELVPRGVIVVLYNWLAENIPGQVALTPGVNLAAYAPDAYGTIPTASALPSLLTELELSNQSGKLAGRLDLQQIILGGHSAGGRVALENANPQFFNQVVAAFGYGSHTAAPIQLGVEPGTILPLANSLPLLLIGGTQDGVIANNAQVYGLERWESAATPVERTFREAIASNHNDSYLVIIDGANHFAICDRPDPTLQVANLDFISTQPIAAVHSLLARLIVLFIELHVAVKPQTATELELLLTDNNPLIALFDRK